MLNDTRIKNFKPASAPYREHDEKGLYLEVRPTGMKVWRWRYRIDGKPNIYTIGEYLGAGKPGHISLDAARAERVRCRDLVKRGIHPKAHKDTQTAVQRLENANTFGAIYEEWIARKKPHWSARHVERVESSFTQYVLPTLRDAPIRSIGTPQLLAVIDPIEHAGHAVTAIDTLAWISKVFRHAGRTGRVDNDPTYALKGHIQRPAVVHKQPLNKDGIREMREDIRKARIFPQTRIALELLMLTFVRPKEMRQGEWTEIDLDRAMWTIPGEKMKKGEKHLVPLSTQAVTFLRELNAITGSGRWLFPSARTPDTCMSPATMNAVLTRLGYAGEFSAHGFRATASTELHELNYDTKIIELQLSHKDRDKVRASYDQAQHLADRRLMMQEWADMIDQWCSGASNVISIGSKAA